MSSDYDRSYRRPPSRSDRDRPSDRDRHGDRYDSRERRGVPLSDLDPALTDVSRKVIGAAIEVHKALGPGFSEDVYAHALQHELESLAVGFKADHSFDVNFKGKKCGSRAADLFVDNRFVVEVMAVPGEIGSLERAQLRALLRVADLELGLIINFAERRLKDGLVRVLNPDKLNLERDDHDDHPRDERDDRDDRDDRPSSSDSSSGGGRYDPDARS